MSEAPWVCVKQRAGPLVKAFTTDRRCFLRRCCNDPRHIRARAAPAFYRTPVDKLELNLALFGYDGVFYTLTFADEFLPERFEDVQRVWDGFIRKLRKWSRDVLERELIYYVYRIEGRHGDKRWHIHVFLRDCDFPPAVVRYLWGFGEVGDEPWTERRVREERGFRGLAIYFTKERVEVGRHAYGSSRALARLIPPPEVRPSVSGTVPVPRGAQLLPSREGYCLGEWGCFQHARYLTP